MRPRNGPFQILEAPEELLGRELFHEHQTSFKAMFGGLESSKTVVFPRDLQNVFSKTSSFYAPISTNMGWRAGISAKVLGPARERISSLKIRKCSRKACWDPHESEFLDFGVPEGLLRSF